MSLFLNYHEGKIEFYQKKARKKIVDSKDRISNVSIKTIR